MGSSTSKSEEEAGKGESRAREESEAPKQPGEAAETVEAEDDDEPDEWDKRIFSTGCADENTKMTDCYWDNNKDWRKCQKEIETFRQCWKAHGNDQRTSMKDVDKKD